MSSVKALLFGQLEKLSPNLLVFIVSKSSQPVNGIGYSFSVQVIDLLSQYLKQNAVYLVLCLYVVTSEDVESVGGEGNWEIKFGFVADVENELQLLHKALVLI